MLAWIGRSQVEVRRCPVRVEVSEELSKAEVEEKLWGGGEEEEEEAEEEEENNCIAALLLRAY